MSRPRQATCVHCLKYFEDLTWDHVFPTSWYPDSTPENLEKWKFPSCEPCNNRYSEIEQSLLVRFALCLTPGEESSSGIPERALDAIKPSLATTEKERRARQAYLDKILGEMQVHETPPSEGVLPGFGPQPGIVYPEHRTIKISKKEIDQFTEKLTRGITWKFEKRLISQEYELSTHILKDNDAWDVYGSMQRAGSLIDLGPGFQIWRATVPEDVAVSALAVQIWGRARFYAMVIKGEM